MFISLAGEASMHHEEIPGVLHSTVLPRLGKSHETDYRSRIMIAEAEVGRLFRRLVFHLDRAV